MNSPFEMVVAIVLIVTVGRIVAAKMGVTHVVDWRRRKAMGFMQPDPQQQVEVERLRSEVERLSQRVQTLERLAVDPSARLAREIDQLRDAQTGKDMRHG